MEPVILNKIQVRLPAEDLFKRLRVGENSSDAANLKNTIREAELVARPRAICGVAYVDNRGEDFVSIDGVRFSSRVLATKLQKSYRVFPYVATSGVELDGWAKGFEAILQGYWADMISQAVVRIARLAVEDYLRERYRLGELSSVSPGFLADWPIEEQQPLFRLLGDTELSVGVHLTDSMLMVPTKSVSGIYFTSEESKDG